MPDNLNQDWTDDAAFWDEAWGDMSARLDQAERKRFFVWWRAIGIGLLALLPIIFFYYSRGTHRTVPTQNPSESSRVILDEVFAKTTPVPQEATVEVDPVTPIEHLPSPGIIQSSTPSGVSENPKPTTPLIATVPVASPVPSNAQPAVPTSPEQIDQQHDENSLPPPSNTRPSLVNDPPAEGEQPLTREVPNAITALPSLPLPLLTRSPIMGGRELSEVREGARRAPLSLEAGINSGGFPDYGGNFIGLRYAVPLGKRLSMPVGLRYEHTNWRINSLNNRPLFESFRNTGASTNTDGIALLADFSSNELDRVITNQIALQIGLEYRIGKRWTIFSSLGFNFYTSGKGPVSDDEGTRLEPLEFAGLNLPLGAASVEDFATDPTGNNDEFRPAPLANSLGLTLNFGTSYRFATRWTVFGEVTTLENPIYRGQAASVSPNRVGIGLRYRFR
jgi:hypothetical protein